MGRQNRSAPSASHERNWKSDSSQIQLRGPEWMATAEGAGAFILCALNLVESIAWAGQGDTDSAQSAPASTVH